MAKKKTISQLKKELDKIFSLYIRLRDATPEGLVKCFTCDKISHYKIGMHAGHFMSRSRLATRWNDRGNVMPQCYRCNIHLSGNQYIYSLRLDEKYGEGTAKELEELSRQTIKMMRIDYEEMIEKYKKKVNKLTKSG
tara:strand:- start:870 stop:1280 length:411 start_codon:yes stop_codon:yes gene_type:complete